MKFSPIYVTPMLEIRMLEVEQVLALSQVEAGTGAGAGGEIQDVNGPGSSEPAYWI